MGQIEGHEAAKGYVLPFSDLMIAASALEQAHLSAWVTMASNCDAL